MKRTVSVFILILLLFSACSNGSSLDDTATFVGEGEMTLIRMLVSSNAYLVDEVFIAGHLPADYDNIIETDEGRFAPVTSDKFKTYEDLEKTVYSTYTEEAGKKLLCGNAIYTEIDGRLCYNLKHNITVKPSVDWSEPKITAKLGEDGKYIINVKVDGKKFEFSAVNLNGNIRLESFYT